MNQTYGMADSFLDLAMRAWVPTVDEWEYEKTFSICNGYLGYIFFVIICDRFFYFLSYDMGKNLTCLAAEGL